ncbi:MAG: pimeloyl-ACP methyl esterase BioG family protein [Chlorobiaceae bacterium]
MKTVWLRKEGAEELLLFFNGWGMDHRIAAYLLHESLSAGFLQDLMVCYDYRTLTPEPGFMNGIKCYGSITVVAWSFGVWAAQHLELPPIELAIAINGTLHPVNAELGIPPEVFQATLSTYSEENRHRFNRRMCGSREALELFSSMSPDRETSDQLAELERLREHLMNRSFNDSADWQYNHAVIGGRDLVFPPQQQYNAWKGVSQTVIADMPHFPFFHFRNLPEVLACCRK